MDAKINNKDKALINRRRKHLGNAEVFFYQTPLHITKSKDVWLFDAEDNKYLDVYNNVAHIGHANQDVIDAITQQSKTLNTSTRYLHESIVCLAEQLTATMPEDLNVCYFTCSGSEANDLALQIARAYSKNQGCIISENAYHGNTTAVFQMSPEDYPLQQRENWIATLPGPKAYLAEPEVFIDQAVLTINQLSSTVGTAAVIFDNVFSSDGIFLPPPGYLRSIYRIVRDAGGLAIADEVQSGFGRTGKHMWGFAHDDVVPDIVTLGKPMGNGHPISAVVTTRKIADVYNKKQAYFNTFGGNPVACAAALAVINFIEKNKLVEHAESVGVYFRQVLNSLAKTHKIIHQIRGGGLFVGVELVSQHPAQDTSTVVNKLKQLGVLAGITGPENNVIKLRPPMTFQKEHADIVASKLNQALDSLV